MNKCPGCGALLPEIEGPTHAYMIASPACWKAFGKLLAFEYSDPELMIVHRLSVDTYAVQHPGDPEDRRAVQSVGLHLARLHLQLENPRPPRETNDVMLGLSKYKDSLKKLDPPTQFGITIAEVVEHAGSPKHKELVLNWAKMTWHDWHAHHAYIDDWLRTNNHGL